ncbi:hypothetical protein [Microbispora hainanensis]|uniref:hypothetical protein n=1 Tax=Microbispora hainanensis TaxID=568844 RepID=UPI00340D0F08
MYSRYEHFHLLDEGGVRPAGETAPYTVPRRTERHLSIPSSFFTNGWIYVLEDSEILFLLMLFLQRSRMPAEGLIKVEEFERLTRFGVGRDTYATHQLITAFGLIESFPGINRKPNGTIPYFAGISGDTPLHEFLIDDNAFDRDALVVAIRTLREISA